MHQGPRQSQSQPVCDREKQSEGNPIHHLNNHVYGATTDERSDKKESYDWKEVLSLHVLDSYDNVSINQSK